MAQLELASLLAPAPVSGATGAASSTLSTETSATTTGGALSFNQLLAGVAQTSDCASAPAIPLAPGQIADALAVGSAIDNPPLPSPAPANDPARVEQAGQTALAAGLVPIAAGAAAEEASQSGESANTGELDSESLASPSDGPAVEAAWLGWPLFLESRAALRDDSALGAAQRPNPSAEAALADSTLEAIGLPPTQFAPRMPGALNSAELTPSSENPLPSSISQTLITDYQGQQASTWMPKPLRTALTEVDSLVLAAPTKDLLSGLTLTPLANQTGPSASDMTQATDLAIGLSKISPVPTELIPRPITPDPGIPTGPPTAAIVKPVSTTVRGAVESGSNVPTPGTIDPTSVLKTATSIQPPASGIIVNVTTNPISAAAETVLTQSADPVASALLASAAGNEQLDWQRRLAQSFARTRQPGAAAESSSRSETSLKSLSALTAKTASDAIDSETGTPGAARLTIPFHGSQIEAQSTGGAGLQRRPLFAVPLAPSAHQPLTAEPTLAIRSADLDNEAPWAHATAADKRMQSANSSPAMADPESAAASALLENRWNASTTATSSAVVTPERTADNGTTTRLVESTPTIAGSAARVDSSTATPPRPAAPTASTPLPTAPEVLDMQQKNWERTLARQLDWAVNNRFQEADIKVNPPDLGPLEMRLTLHHNQTNVMFFSHEAAVREALETALPRLRELLDNQGITLNQAQVSDQSLARHQASTGEQSGYGQRERNRAPLPADAEASVETAQPRSRSRNRRGAVDDYA